MISSLILTFNNVCFAIDEIKENEQNLNIKNSIQYEKFNNSGLTYVILSICSDSSNEFSRGKSNMQDSFGHHSWLAITNMGTVPININGIEVPIFNTITVGTWQGIRHNGIYYNIERYYYEKGDFSETESSYKMMLLNDFELNYVISLLACAENDKWSITNNCAFFAEKIWNKISSTKISAGIIKCPLILYQNILNLGGKRGFIMSSPQTELYYGGKNPVKFML